MKRNHFCSTMLTMSLCLLPAVLTQSAIGQIAIFDNTAGGPLDGPKLDPGDRYLAQQFSTGEFDNISSASVNLRRVAAPNGHVQLSVWDTNESGVPGSMVGVLGDIDLGSVSTSHDFVTIEESITGLSPNSPYFLVLDAIDATLPLRFGILTSSAANFDSNLLAKTGNNWPTVDSLIGPHPVTGERADAWQMKVESMPNLVSDIVLYDNMELLPLNSIPGAIGPRFTSKQEDSAQQFLTGDSDNVASVALYLNKVGSPRGEVAVEIWEDSTGVPSSLVSTVGTINLEDLSSSPEEVTFDTLVTGLSPNSAYHVVLNNINTSITSAQDSYREGVLGHRDDVQSEGTNGAAFMLGSTPVEFNGAWTPLLETLGCHPTGGCPNYRRMSVTASALLGDFDKDGTLDADDVDQLSHQVLTAPENRSYDLNNDTTLTSADRVTWVHDLANTYFGDANLDGEFNSGDLTEVFKANEYEDNIMLNSTWAEGDWNGDGDFDSGDLVVAFKDGGYEVGLRVATHAVPEPSSAMLILLGITCGLGRYQRGLGT